MAHAPYLIFVFLLSAGIRAYFQGGAEIAKSCRAPSLKHVKGVVRMGVPPEAKEHTYTSGPKFKAEKVKPKRPNQAKINLDDVLESWE